MQNGLAVAGNLATSLPPLYKSIQKKKFDKFGKVSNFCSNI